MKNFTITLLLLLLPLSVLFAQTNHVVQMLDSEFSPATISIEEGDTVTWVNNGNFNHTSTSGTNCTADGMFNSGNMSPGSSFSFVFTSSGTVPYYCIPHCGAGMTGSITVGTPSSVKPEKKVRITVSPNPATSFVEIAGISSKSEITYALYDMTGKVRIQSDDQQLNEENRIDISTLPSGMYILQISIDGKFTHTTRVVKK